MDHVSDLVLRPGGELPVLPSNVLGGVVAGLSLLHAAMPKELDEALALVPHHTIFPPVAALPIPFVWNVATAHLFEEHVLKAALIAPALVMLTRMLERLWSVKAIVAHLTFSALCSGSLVFVAELFHVYRTHHLPEFFLPIRGAVGLLVSVAVGLRHAYPLEPVPVLPRSLGLQCQHLPFGLALLVTLVSLVAPRSMMAEWLFAPLSFFYGWLHIRYLMWFPFAGTHGDHSPDFCFAALFPRPLRPIVSCFGSIFYAIGASVCPGWFKLRQAEGDVGHSIVYDPSRGCDFGGASGGGAATGMRPPGPALGAGATSDGPGSQEYNARRAKALQLLDENINSLLAPSTGRSTARGMPLSMPGEEFLKPAVSRGGDVEQIPDLEVAKESADKDL